MKAPTNTAKITTDGMSIEVERVANHVTIHGAIQGVTSMQSPLVSALRYTAARGLKLRNFTSVSMCE